MNYAISVQNTVKNYKSFTLGEVNLNLPKGSIMGLIGENGAGKTTLIKCILGVCHADSGNISVLNHPAPNLPSSIREDIGVVFDDLCYPETLNSKDVGSIMKKMYKSWDSRTYTSYLDQFDLLNKKSIKDYSRGMKMKLSLAVALSHDAKLLILDEATAGLDPVKRDEVLEILLDFIQDEEKSVLISSHITSDLEKVCDYITFLKDGKVLISGVKDDIVREYGILRCTIKDFDELKSFKGIAGYQRNSFGVSALVDRSRFMESISLNNPFAFEKTKGSLALSDFVIDDASLEDILLYNVRGN